MRFLLFFIITFSFKKSDFKVALNPGLANYLNFKYNFAFPDDKNEIIEVKQLLCRVSRRVRKWYVSVKQRNCYRGAHASIGIPVGIPLNLRAFQNA